MGLRFHLRLEGLHLFGHSGLGLYEVYLCQKLVRVEHLLNVGTQLVAEYRQDADDLTALGSFQLAHLVVGLHHLGRFYEYRLARCTLVVHNTVDLALQAWCHGNHQSAVAQGGGDILGHQSFPLCRMQYSI